MPAATAGGPATAAQPAGLRPVQLGWLAGSVFIVSAGYGALLPVLPGWLAAHFSDRGRLFQADRGRRFSAIVDARGLRASEVFNVSQSSTIRLKGVVDGQLPMRP